MDTVHIRKAHLLNNGKAPNLCLSVSNRVCYSNSNPDFVVGK